MEYWENIWSILDDALKDLEVFTAIFNDWKELIRNTVKIAPAYVFIGGEKVARTKINLLTHCLKMSKLMTAKELWAKHNDFVHGCDLDEYKINTYHAFETIARRSYKIIFSSAQSLRYYDMTSKDFTKLFEGLNLRKYYNSEISTNLLFRETIKNNINGKYILLRCNIHCTVITLHRVHY